ncbi:hypothetical protein MUY27_03080 [Mucilaginibacter sp. RS28]|uniref:Uncharacterized protein n=1 Tax=Mucilaginibacter straminoryzae TaxID=2932774 RepID=A0A9X1X2B2_9SPHI|nr:hypothetical protein [Mucilaginibacter straminoryzae]MCJ8208675.1 hypothetical protein [Mucilaginibacter straminoryzae]
MESLIKISQKIKTELWWLIISVDFNYSRICIADYDLDENQLVLWLEDKHDYKNTLDECLQLQVPLKQFGRLINNEQLNSYDVSEMHPENKFVYRSRRIINDAINWYRNDASLIQQQWAREALLKHVLTQLVENEIFVY